MNIEWSDYVASLDLTTAAHASLERAFNVATTLSPEPLKSLFVSDLVDNEGRRVVENAWFFSDSYVFESKDFLSSGNCDLLVLEQSVTYLEVRWRDYDFVEGSDDSRLFARFDTSDGSVSELKAARKNCDVLLDVLLSHIKTNLWSLRFETEVESENGGLG